MAKKTLTETVDELKKELKGKDKELAAMRSALARYADDDNWTEDGCALGADVAKEALG